MTAEEIAHSVQFLVDHQGETTAVVVTPELWQRLLTALEDVEDLALVQALKTRLKAGPQASGALRWNDVSQDWA
jgi:hypothetical protein